MQAWIGSPLGLGPPRQTIDSSTPQYLTGPYVIWDPRTMTRATLPEEFVIDVNQFEPQRLAQPYIQEQLALKESSKSPGAAVNGNGNGYAR